MTTQHIVRKTSLIVVAAAAVSSLTLPRAAAAQVAVELHTSTDSIPTVVNGVTIKSWSVFLICAPDWVLPESADQLWELYWQFLNFGTALGPEHAAIWFWSRDPGTPDSGEIHTAIDVVRSTAFCSRFELAPSESPYLVIMTDYPGAGFASQYSQTIEKPDNYAVVQLRDKSAGEMTRLLEALVDRIFTGEINKISPETEGFWRAWQHAFETVRSGLVGFTSSLRVIIKTAFFYVVIEPN